MTKKQEEQFVKELYKDLERRIETFEGGSHVGFVERAKIGDFILPISIMVAILLYFSYVILSAM